MIPLRWVILFAIISLPLMILLVLMLCLALAVLPAFAIVASLGYAFSSKGKKKARMSGPTIDAEYRIIRDEDRVRPTGGRT